MSKAPGTNESWIAFFRRTKRFADLMLLAWHVVEYDVDQLFVREYGMRLTDYEAYVLLRELPFDTKLQILRKLGAISKKDYAVVHDFQEYRNKLFHGRDPVFFLMADAEREAAERRRLPPSKFFRALVSEPATPRRTRLDPRSDGAQLHVVRVILGYRIKVESNHNLSSSLRSSV